MLARNFCSTQSSIPSHQNLEQDLSLCFNDIALLLFLPLATIEPTEELVMQIAKEVGKIESTTQRQEVSGYVQLMAGLRCDKTLIKKLFQEDIMKESIIYQEIFETGEQQGLQREKSYIIRQIIRKVGELPQDIRSTIELLSIDQLETLGEALLDFTNLQDLQNWLRNN